jgi:hypothetical protein
MAAQENTSLVRRAYNSIREGDLDACLELFADDVQWRLPDMVNVFFAGNWQGREGVRRFFNKFPNYRISSNLNRTNSSRKTTGWSFWVISLCESKPRAETSVQNGRTSGQSRRAELQISMNL